MSVPTTIEPTMLPLEAAVIMMRRTKKPQTQVTAYIKRSTAGGDAKTFWLQVRDVLIHKGMSVNDY